MVNKPTSLREHLVNYFSSGVKESGDEKLGVEIEHFILSGGTDKAVSYFGANGIKEILKEHMLCFPDAKPIGKENLLGFETEDFSITLEPAGQYELSISPKKNISDIEKSYCRFRETLKPILDKFGYYLFTEGYFPVETNGQIIPKARYRFMSQYFREKGTNGLEMMCRTASTQISIDYHSQEDFRRKIQVAYFLTPIFQLLTNNVYCAQGDNTYYLKRVDVWRNTDNDRCGVLPEVFSERYNFDMYADYLCNVPLIIEESTEGTVYVGNKTAKELYDGVPSINKRDIQHIVSIVFPDVRLKNYLEIRCADSLPTKQMLAYAALVKTVMYSDKALNFCQKFIVNNQIEAKDVLEAQDNLMKNGWRGVVYGVSVVEAAKKLVDFACEQISEKERCYLQPLHNKISLSERIMDEYCFLIGRDMQRNKKGALEIMDDMKHSPLFFHGDYITQALCVPKIYSKETIDKFEKIVSMTYSIFIKVIHEYLVCEDYRRLFPFSSELEELILLSRDDNNLLPLARFDIFYHEDTGEFYFCEVNADGSSGMNEDRVLAELFIDNPAHQEIIRNYDLKPFELFDSWVQTFLKLYYSWSNHVDNPTIAIVDFLDTGMLNDFKEFARRFQKAGVNCEICDVREFKFEDGKLISSAGHKVDAIYRRAVTNDIMLHKGEVQSFLSAIKSHSVFLAGSFCTQIVHNKWLFKVLHDERTKRFLTDEENNFVKEHIPFTDLFGEKGISISEVVDNKDSYILKPMDSYGSNGVFAGIEFSKHDWKIKTESLYGKDYICQKYCPQYQTKNIDFAWGDGKWHSYINMSGLYVYDGKLAGIYSRLGQGSIIASHRNKCTVPTFVV